MSLEYPEKLKKLILNLARARMNQHVSLGVLKITQSLKNDFGVALDTVNEQSKAHITCQSTDALFEELEEWCSCHNFSIDDAVLLSNRIYDLGISRGSSSQDGKTPHP